MFCPKLYTYWCTHVSLSLELCVHFYSFIHFVVVSLLTIHNKTSFEIFAFTTKRFLFWTSKSHLFIHFLSGQFLPVVRTHLYDVLINPRNISKLNKHLGLWGVECKNVHWSKSRNLTSVLLMGHYIKTAEWKGRTCSFCFACCHFSHFLIYF